MKVLTVKEMQAADYATMKKLMITTLDLMKRAGYMLVKDFLHRVHPKQDELINLIVGTGNNGGDALVMASELNKLGFLCQVFILGEIANDNKELTQLIDQLDTFVNLKASDDIETYAEQIMASAYIIDGIFGNGLNKDIIGYRAELIDLINQSDALVYAIDIPSGLDPNSGLVLGHAVKAKYTGVIGFFRLGHLLNDALDYCGETALLDIGMISDTEDHRQFIDLSEYTFSPYKPQYNDHKYSIGQGIFIGGQAGMMGSIQMAAMAGLKSGLGIVKVYCPDLKQGFTQFYPEIVINQAFGEDLEKIIQQSKVFCYGPGLNENLEAKHWLEKLLLIDKPLVIDGRGLDDIRLEKVKNPLVILTPHAGELARLFNVDTKTVIKAPLLYLDKLTDLGYHVIYKGPCTIIASNQERIFLQSKNPGLATAGSGDVFAGILSACLAHQQGLQAMVDAVYIHALAGHHAKGQLGVVSMTATDIINHIRHAFIEEESS